MIRNRGRFCALIMVAAAAFWGTTACAFAQGGGPWGCVQWPIADYGEGILYYADYYENSCDDTPEAAYVFGDYDWPQTCPDCVPAFNDGAASKQFRGLDAPVEQEFVLQLPEGPARDFAKAIELPSLKNIQFKNASGTLITAKVFAFKVFKRSLLRQSVPDEGRTIVVAMQVKGQPSVPPVSIECAPLDKSGACCAYSARYDAGAGQQIPMLVLTAK